MINNNDINKWKKICYDDNLETAEEFLKSYITTIHKSIKDDDLIKFMDEACRILHCVKIPLMMLNHYYSFPITDNIEVDPICSASIFGRSDLLNVILEKSNKNINEYFRYGLNTPVHFAGIKYLELKYNSYINIIELLLQYKADIDNTGHNGNSILYSVCLSHQSDNKFIKFLVEKGANINRLNCVNPSRIQYDIYVTKSGIRSIEETALHMACRKLRPHVMITLLECNADIFIYNNSGYTPFHMLCYRNNENDDKIDSDDEERIFQAEEYKERVYNDSPIDRANQVALFLEWFN